MNRDATLDDPLSSRRKSRTVLPRKLLNSVMRTLAMLATVVAVGTSAACHMPGKSITARYKNVEPFNFDIALGPKNYHIEGYLTRSTTPGKLPGLLVLNDGGGSVERCVQMSQHGTTMGIQGACVD